jgi:hypothetical protein
MRGFKGRETRHLHCPHAGQGGRGVGVHLRTWNCFRTTHTSAVRAAEAGVPGSSEKNCRSGDVHLPLGYPGRPCRGREQAQAEVRNGGFSSDSGDSRASGAFRACRRGRRHYGCSCERRFRNCREALTTNPVEELHPRRNADIQSVCNHGGTCRYSHGCNLTVYRHSSGGAILRTVPGAPGKLSKNGTQCP